MNTLNYEFQIADQHFTEIVRAVRAKGGEVTDVLMTLEGLTAGYSYTPGILKVHFEQKALDNKVYPAEPPLLDIINEVKTHRYPAVWPPEPAEKPAVPKVVARPVSVIDQVPDGPDGKPMPFNPPELAPKPVETKPVAAAPVLFAPVPPDVEPPVQPIVK